MKQWWILTALLTLAVALAAANNPHGVDLEDNDFAEFEDFEDEEGQSPDVVVEPKDEEQKVPINEPDLADEDDATVEDEEDEFEHLQDDEEFVGYDKENRIKGKGNEEPHKLKINTVPYHLRTNWDSFYMEMLMLAGLGVYFLNFLAGKSKNSRLAQAWFQAHKELLESNFSLVGDDGQAAEPQGGELIKESENVYSLWCSGRMCCEGMLVTLKLLKRQDLVGTIARMFKPASDQIVVKITLDEGEMDTYVFCLANKKVGTKMQKDMNDLSLFCTEKKGGEKYDLPSCFQIFSEMGEATAALLDRQTKACLTKFENQVEYIHISDQYSGVKTQDDSQNSKVPEAQRVLIFCFNVANKSNAGPKDMEAMKPLMQLVFHCLDRTRRIRLSRESKIKAERNRQKVSETHLKATHAQRHEASQARREEKRRAEKERIMAEEDPDKQRKWEERENRREMKKKQPKVKMMKIKAM